MSDGATSDKTYQPFANDAAKYDLATPTNGRLKKLMRSELKLAGMDLQAKIETAQFFGWEPTDVIPNHSRTEVETIEQDGERVEREVVRDNDLEPIGISEHLAEVAEIVLDGCTVNGRDDDLRPDQVGQAKRDFMSFGSVTSGGFGI